MYTTKESSCHFNTYMLDCSSESPRRHCDDGLARTVTRLMLFMPLRARRSPLGRVSFKAPDEPVEATVADDEAPDADGTNCDDGCATAADLLAVAAAQRGTISSCM